MHPSFFSSRFKYYAGSGNGIEVEVEGEKKRKGLEKGKRRKRKGRKKRMLSDNDRLGKFILKVPVHFE